MNSIIMFESANFATIVLTVLGIGILAFGSFYAQKIRSALGRGRVKEAWDKLIGMIFAFILGYIIYLVQITTDSKFIELDLLVACVFFAGSVFVALVAYLNYDALT